MGSTLHRARAPAHGPYGPDTSAARRWTRRRGAPAGGPPRRRTRRRGAPAGGPPRRPARSAFSTPIGHWAAGPFVLPGVRKSVLKIGGSAARDRKSTRLNSSHVAISYAAFCFKTTTTRSGVVLHHPQC